VWRTWQVQRVVVAVASAGKMEEAQQIPQKNDPRVVGSVIKRREEADLASTRRRHPPPADDGDEDTPLPPAQKRSRRDGPEPAVPSTRPPSVATEVPVVNRRSSNDSTSFQQNSNNNASSFPGFEALGRLLKAQESYAGIRSPKQRKECYKDRNQPIYDLFQECKKEKTCGEVVLRPCVRFMIPRHGRPDSRSTLSSSSFWPLKTSHAPRERCNPSSWDPSV
jgi:hypothetical protein